MTPPYVRYLRGEQPWPETVVLWPFGKEWRQAARRAKAERIAREALNRPDIHALVLRQAQDIPTDAFQIAELLIRAITSHVLAKRVALPLDPYVFALLAEQIQQIGRAYFEQRVTQYDSQISPCAYDQTAQAATETPIDPHEHARKRLVPNKSFETDAAKSAAPFISVR
jgi:hypothetical protein